MVSEAELAARVRRRARRAMLAGIAALNAAPPALRRSLTRLTPEAVHDALSVAVLRFVVLRLARSRGLFQVADDFSQGRLFEPRSPLLDIQPSLQGGQVVWHLPEPLRAAQATFEGELGEGLDADGVTFGDCPVELIGNLYELLLGESVTREPGGALELGSGTQRKKTGTFFTPQALTEVVVRRALEPLERRGALLQASALRVCDPTVGGGAFLVETARQLAQRGQATVEVRRAIVREALFGVDIDPVAVAVAEAALCLFVGDPHLLLQEAGRNLRVADALLGPPYAAASRPASDASSRLERRLGGCDLTVEFSEVFARGGFDLVIGNPPWVAYAGRAAKPLSAARKAYFGLHFTALKGYPTLHGLFVERSASLAPRGTVALVVPSPIADLQGYRAVRRAVRRHHSPCEPMLEFGQDAFESVTQPCFALIADAHGNTSVTQPPSDEPFRLVERQRAGATAVELAPPTVLALLAKAAPFPRELFGEMGFQTTSRVTQTLLLRAAEPSETHHYPLLEGRDVRAFSQGSPRLFLAPDRAALLSARCRLRDRQDYGRVEFVVRQTARYPIAARHGGLPFRNSLLAGFEVEGLDPDLVVGLLNSTLYRALHLSMQRDARQATFPQVKVSHLRSLPVPPLDAGRRAHVAELSAQLTRDVVTAEASGRLDEAVFELFGLDVSSARAISEFLAARTGARG